MRLPLPIPSREHRPFDALVAGGNSIDLVALVSPYPERNSKHRMDGFAQMAGGSAATAAVAMARLGLTVHYVGRFGDDDFGRAGLRSLQDEGVDTNGAITVPGATSRFAMILVEKSSGDRTVLWHLDPRVQIVPGDVRDSDLAAARVLLVDCQDTEGVADAARRARLAGTRTVVDVEQARPGILDLLREIDVVIAAEAFPGALTGKADLGAALAALQHATGAGLVCVTLGEQGSLARCGGREIRTPAFRVDPHDTTGAGDAFRGGFIAGWLALGELAEVEDILRYANAVAALNCREVGARTSLPRRNEVEALLR